jgi:dTDP-4-dehydrorhamnose reductase
MLGQQLMNVFAGPGTVGWDRDEIDITDEASARRKISTLGPKVIINAAAYTDVDGAEAEREAAFAVNERGVRAVAEAARAVRARLVHFSTDYVFPGDNESGYGEDVVPGPAVNVYGDSKLAGERALAEIAPEYFLLRTAWLYGPGGKNFVDTMLKLGQERKELEVIDDQHGSPTFARDLALATREVVAGDFKPGVYHMVNAGVTTWYGFAQEIFHQAGLKLAVKPIDSRQFPLPARRPQYGILFNTRGPVLRPWQDALAEYIKELTSI